MLLQVLRRPLSSRYDKQRYILSVTFNSLAGAAKHFSEQTRHRASSISPPRAEGEYRSPISFSGLAVSLVLLGRKFLVGQRLGSALF